MKKLFPILGLLLLTNTAAQATEDIAPTIEQCLSSFAENYVPEYNDKNEFIFSTSKKDILGALDVLKSNTAPNYIIEFSKANLQFADAVGVVFNYDDESHMIYTSIHIVNDKCQVKELYDINSVDITDSTDKGFKPEVILSKYFLGKSKNSLPGHAKDWLYDAVSASLKGE